MKGHRYRLTLDYLEDAKGQPEVRPPLQFEVKNHDDLYAIVERVKAKGLFADDDEATAFAIGLKLFREVMLHNRKLDLFQELDPHFSSFMKAFKAYTP